MSNTNRRHRSKRLDALIGQKVSVIFFDENIAIGVLGFCEITDLQAGHRAGYYFLERPHGDVNFRKSHVYRVWPTGETVKMGGLRI